MIRGLIAVAAVGALTACSDFSKADLPPIGMNLLKSTYQTAAFKPAKINIVAPTRRELRTFALRPCGDTVCGSRRASVTTTADGAVIAGAYPGVTFTLAPGGGGTLQSGSSSTDIVWDFAD